MQDSDRLDILNIPAVADRKRSDFSRVALLQNLIGYWLVLSLVQASNSELFELRINFLMEAFATANKKLPGLPEYATADMYLPFISFANVLSKSNLKLHEMVKRQAPILAKLAGRFTAMALTHYTNGIKIEVGKKQVSLPPMRMQMTTQLSLSSELSGFMTKGKEKICQKISPEQKEQLDREKCAKAAVERGRLIYDYFNPTRKFCYLNPLSPDSYQMLCQIPELEFLSKHIEHLDLVDLLAFALPVYEELSTIDKRLGVLEGGGILSHARIYYYAKQVGRLVCLEDESALDFIESHVCDIMSRVASDGSLDLAYGSAVGDWCSDILRQIAQVRPLQGGALAGGFFGCRPLRAINDTNHDCAPSAPVC